MRTTATALVAAIIAASLSNYASAETLSTDGITYYTYESGLSAADDAQPANYYGYGEPSVFQENEVNYAPEGNAYQLIEETPTVYQDSTGAAYNATEIQTVSDAAGNTLITEVIDGIVYETLISENSSAFEGIQALQTY